MFFPGCAFSARTASTTSRAMRVELRQAEASARVVETTYFGMAFSTSPKVVAGHGLEGAAVDLPGLAPQEQRVALADRLDEVRANAR